MTDIDLTLNTKTYQQQYYQDNKAKHIAYMTEYHKENNDKHKAYMLTYYRKNKEKFDAFSRTKRHCKACDRGYGYTNFSKHTRSAMHKRNQDLLDKQDLKE